MTHTLTRVIIVSALACVAAGCGGSDASGGSTPTAEDAKVTTVAKTTPAKAVRTAAEVAKATAAVRQRVTYIAGLVAGCRNVVGGGKLADARVDCTDGNAIHRIGQKDVYDFDIGRELPDARLDVQVTITDDQRGFTVQAYATTNDGRVYFSHIEPRPGAIRLACGSEPLADDAAAPVGAPALPDCIGGTWKAVASH